MCGIETACAQKIGEITDTLLEELHAGFRACVGTSEEAYAALEREIHYAYFANIASFCGLPEGTLKLNAPPLTSCQGAVAKLHAELQ